MECASTTFSASFNEQPRRRKKMEKFQHLCRQIKSLPPLQMEHILLCTSLFRMDRPNPDHLLAWNLCTPRSIVWVMKPQFTGKWKIKDPYLNGTKCQNVNVHILISSCLLRKLSRAITVRALPKNKTLFVELEKCQPVDLMDVESPLIFHQFFWLTKCHPKILKLSYREYIPIIKYE